jgi:hypothetical protein
MTLLVSSLAYSEIHEAGSGNWGSTEIAAYAYGDNTDDEVYDSGFNIFYTDTAGWFDWEYVLTDCVAVCGKLMEDKWAYAKADSDSNVGGPTSDSHSAFVYFNMIGEYDDQYVEDNSPGPTPNPSGEGNSYFEAYTGIYIYVIGIVEASIEEGSGCYAYAQVYSWSDCFME